MEFFKLFLLGASGYLLAALYDIALLLRYYRISKVLYLGFFVTALPFFFLFSRYDSPHSPIIGIILILFMVVSAGLLIYSVLVEIPLKNKEQGNLYTGGTYKICRHPGFLWFSLFNIFVSLFFWYTPITLILAGYTLCNLALVTLEDQVLFPKMFPGYGAYKKTTHFLIPH
ncbi:MAG: hypothetical protein ACQ5SW_10765 [Sphaerochaetaceae bacterium]